MTNPIIGRTATVQPFGIQGLILRQSDNSGRFLIQFSSQHTDWYERDQFEVAEN